VSFGNGLQPWRKTVPLLPDESICSVAVRLAPRGVLTVEELLILNLGLKPPALAGLPANLDAIRELAYIGSFDLDVLLARSWRFTDSSVHFLGREMPIDWIVAEKRRLAPAMLADKSYTRMLWPLRAFTSDLTTGEYLVDTCYCCGKPLRWDRDVPFTECGSCKRDQRERNPTFVPADTLEAERELHRFIIGEAPALPPPFGDLPDLAVFEAMEWLAYFTDLTVGKSLRPSVHYAAKGLGALKDWPFSFDNVISKFLGVHADPPEAASGRVKMELLQEFLVAAGRVKHPDLHHILTTRAVEFLSDASQETAIHNKFFKPLQTFQLSAKVRYSKRGRPEWRSISAMRSSQR
jgi:hypothetical protein